MQRPSARLEFEDYFVSKTLERTIKTQVRNLSVAAMVALSLMLLPACGASSANRSGALSGDPVTTTCTNVSEPRVKAEVSWGNTLNTAITQANFKFDGIGGALGTKSTATPGKIKFSWALSGNAKSVTVQLLDGSSNVLQTTSATCTGP